MQVPFSNKEATKINYRHNLHSQNIFNFVLTFRYPLDIKLAAEVDEVDVVVGGHTHTFLYSGTPPSNDLPEGPYPTFVEQTRTGKTVPVVQAYCYTKYMGHLTLQVDRETGDLLEPVEGSGVSLAKVILLDSSVKEDQEVLDLLEVYKPNLTEYLTVYGNTGVDLVVRGY